MDCRRISQDWRGWLWPKVLWPPRRQSQAAQAHGGVESEEMGFPHAETLLYPMQQAQKETMTYAYLLMKAIAAAPAPSQNQTCLATAAQKAAEPKM